MSWLHISSDFLCFFPTELHRSIALHAVCGKMNHCIFFFFLTCQNQKFMCWGQLGSYNVKTGYQELICTRSECRKTFRFYWVQFRTFGRDIRFLFSLLPLPLSGIQSSSFDGLQIIKEFHIREECFGEATLRETEWMREKLVFWRFATGAFIVQTAYKQGYESHYQWSKLHPACMSKLTKA